MKDTLMSNLTNKLSPWEALANAIVLQAIQDYRSCLKILKKNPDNKIVFKESRRIEKFFRQNMYTQLDGETLITYLRKEQGL